MTKLTDATARALNAAAAVPVVPGSDEWLRDTSLPARIGRGLRPRSAGLQLVDENLERLNSALDNLLVSDQGPLFEREQAVADALVMLQESAREWLIAKGDQGTARLNDATMAPFQALMDLAPSVAAMPPEDRSKALADLALARAMQRYATADDPAYGEFKDLAALMAHARSVGSALAADPDVQALHAAMVPPKTLHMVWTGGTPEKAIEAAQLWAAGCPGHEVVVWTDFGNLLGNAFRQYSARLRHDPALPNGGVRGQTDQTLLVRENQWGRVREEMEVNPALVPDDLVAAELAGIGGDPNDVLTPPRQRLGNLAASLAGMPNVRIRDVNELWNAQGFEGIERVDQELLDRMHINYQREITGRCNLAAASDILRPLILLRHPGVYMDVDIRPPMQENMLAGVAACDDLLAGLRQADVPDEQVQEVATRLREIGAMAFEIQAGMLSGDQARQLDVGLPLKLMSDLNARLQTRIDEHDMAPEDARALMAALQSAIEAARERGATLDTAEAYDFSGMSEGVAVHPDLLRARDTGARASPMDALNNNLLAVSHAGSAAAKAYLHNIDALFTTVDFDVPRTALLADIEPATPFADLDAEQKRARALQTYFDDRPANMTENFRPATIEATGPGMLKIGIQASRGIAGADGKLQRFAPAGHRIEFERMDPLVPSDLAADLLAAPRDGLVDRHALPEFESGWLGQSILSNLIKGSEVQGVPANDKVMAFAVRTVPDDLRDGQTRLVLVREDERVVPLSLAESELLRDVLAMRDIHHSAIVEPTVVLEVPADRLGNTRVDICAEYLRAMAREPALEMPEPPAPALGVDDDQEVPAHRASLSR